MFQRKILILKDRQIDRVSFAPRCRVRFAKLRRIQADQTENG